MLIKEHVEDQIIKVINSYTVAIYPNRVYLYERIPWPSHKLQTLPHTTWRLRRSSGEFICCPYSSTLARRQWCACSTWETTCCNTNATSWPPSMCLTAASWTGSLTACVMCENKHPLHELRTPDDQSGRGDMSAEEVKKSGVATQTVVTSQTTLCQRPPADLASGTPATPNGGNHNCHAL